MYFTDDSLFPENMQPLIITAAPYGPEWLPGDITDLPLTWDQQVQAAVDCYNAGATMLHFHVRDPKTGQGSANFEQYNDLLGRIRQAVPKMIIQVGGSISFAPHTDDAKAKWLDYDTRHMLDGARPEAGIRHGDDRHDAVGCDASVHAAEDIKGTHLDDPKVQAAWSGMVVDSTPAFYDRAPQAAAREEDPALFRTRHGPPSRDHRAADSHRRLHGAAERGAVRLWRRFHGAQSRSTGWRWCAARRTGRPA